MSNKPSLKKGRVILTYGRSLMALTAAHSLGKRNIDIVGCDDVGMTVLSFSKYCSEYFVHPKAEDDEDKYIQSLIENVEKYKPDDDAPYVFMPMFRDAELIAKHANKFPSYISIATPDYDTINKVVSKTGFAKTCQSLDLPIPETHIVENKEKLEELLPDIEYPVLIKTPEGVGGHGIETAKNEDNLKTLFFDSLDEYGCCPIIQEIINGKDYCLTAICDKGEIIESMAYTNIYQYPRKTGAGCMRETVDASPFMDSATKLLKSLEWHGVAEIDFRWDGKKRS